MDWEQKFQAASAISNISLKMRKPGDWYVSHRGVETQAHGSGRLVSSYGNGATPAEAIANHWAELTKEGRYVVLHATSPEKRRHVTWNGFMWVDQFSSLPNKEALGADGGE